MDKPIRENEEQKVNILKKEWHSPEVTELVTDGTASTVGDGSDGGGGLSSSGGS